MEFSYYQNQMAQQGYRLQGDIYRDEKGKPKCFNPVFQRLLTRIKEGDILSRREYELYGRLFMTLVRIVLNNQKFKYQDEDIREECALEAYSEALPVLPKYYDPAKGTGYAYAFRVIYTNMIHVLERKNARGELETNLIERYEDDRLDCGHKVETPVYN